MWQLLFWGSLGLVLYTYAGYPLILFLMGRARSRRDGARRDGPTPSVCLIISAHNEERVIRQKIENSLALERPGRMQIVAASDGSDDRTVAIAREYADHGVCVHESPVRRGKNAVLNDVMRECREDIVVFTDANTLLAGDAVVRLVGHFRDPRVGCAVGELVYADHATPESLYWRYESKIMSLESRLGSVLIANGPIFAMRRELFRELHLDVANDFQTPFDVANQGKAVVYDPSAIAVERSADLWREEFDRKVRIVLQGVTGLVRLRDRMHGLRLWQFVSHKLIRWCVGAFLIVTFVANAALVTASPSYAAFFALQLLCYATALAGWMARRRRKLPRVLQVPFYFTMVNAAALTAMTRYLVGRRQVVWDKAESTRDASGSQSAFAPGAFETVAAAAGDASVRRTTEK